MLLPVTGAPPSHLDVPYSGWSAVVIIALFVLINAAALYAGWRFMPPSGDKAAR